MAPIPWRTASCAHASTPLEQCHHIDAEPGCPRKLPIEPPPPTFVYCYHAFNGVGLPGKRSPGVLALAARATIDLPLDTRLDAGAPRGDGSRTSSFGSRSRVSLGFLTSYAGGMGRARITCHGCTCAPSTVDAHRVDADRNVSVFSQHQFDVVGASAQCVVRVHVLEASSTGGHKFKLSVLTVTSMAQGPDADAGILRMQPAADGNEDGDAPPTVGTARLKLERVVERMQRSKEAKAGGRGRSHAA